MPEKQNRFEDDVAEYTRVNSAFQKRIISTFREIQQSILMHNNWEDEASRYDDYFTNYCEGDCSFDTLLYRDFAVFYVSKTVVIEASSQHGDCPEYFEVTVPFAAFDDIDIWIKNTVKAQQKTISDAQAQYRHQSELEDKARADEEYKQFLELKERFEGVENAKRQKELYLALKSKFEPEAV